MIFVAPSKDSGIMRICYHTTFHFFKFSHFSYPVPPVSHMAETEEYLFSPVSGSCLLSMSFPPHLPFKLLSPSLCRMMYLWPRLVPLKMINKDLRKAKYSMNYFGKGVEQCYKPWICIGLCLRTLSVDKGFLLAYFFYRYVEQSNLMMEKRNNSLQTATENTQARVLHAEQEKVK